MSEARPGQRTRSAFALGLADRIAIALIAAMVVAAKMAVRLPLHIPGHSGLILMALFVIARVLIPKVATATIVGLVAGVLIAFLAPSKDGVFALAKYAAMGLGVDAVALFIPGGLRSPVAGALAGAAGNMLKLSTSYALGAIAGVPHGYLALGLGMAATTHVVFGLLGGWLGSIAGVRLERALGRTSKSAAQ